MIRLTVAGRPIAKERPRVVAGRAYTPDRTKSYEDAIRWEMRLARVRPIAGDVALTIRFYLKGKRRPDTDNLVKAVMDGLQAPSDDRDSPLCAFADDVQVVRIVAERLRDDSNPRTEIEIRPIDPKEVDVDATASA